ncbi:hypothetical protein KA017_00860 [Candidatus Woesebacteria bacterium]|nr:hypothetical protein [Candidatus Woesebacteria bacterium]
MIRVVNPETKAKIVPTSLMVDSGVHIDTNGRSQFSSPEEVMTWRRAVEINGRWWALLHFFDRKNFPQVK